MKCPYCKTGYKYESAKFEKSVVFGDVIEDGVSYSIFYGECPECIKFIVALEEREIIDAAIESFTSYLFPKFINRSVEPEVPDNCRQDFLEAASQSLIKVRKPVPH